MSEIENTGSSAFRPPRWKGRKGLLVGVSIVVCLALALDYFIISSMKKKVQQDTPQQGFLEDITQEVLQVAIAEADRLDPGWRIQELEAKRAVIPDEQNSALVIMAARNLIPDDTN